MYWGLGGCGCRGMGDIKGGVRRMLQADETAIIMKAVYIYIWRNMVKFETQILNKVCI